MVSANPSKGFTQHAFAISLFTPKEQPNYARKQLNYDPIATMNESSTRYNSPGEMFNSRYSGSGPYTGHNSQQKPYFANGPGNNESYAKCRCCGSYGL